MPNRLMIRDIAIVAEVINGKSPGGESFYNAEAKSSKSLTEKERESMLDRLKLSIDCLMMLAEEDH